ncbi:MAG: alpha/beta fold hydrolase [Beduini sp.]|uniref:alpha/beta fold hydrolase n=1 Tax=Beduini sp. TaxID=1922300 RepID=UPI0039A3DAA6
MRLLFLYGVNCTVKIWKDLNPYFKETEIDYVEYPHEITLTAAKVEDLTRWVYTNYGNNQYDAIIGHSLGGIIALQLAAKYKMKCKQIIYLDTNLKPAEEFYRNVMTPKHMELYGAEVLQMFNEERLFYRKELFACIQGDFDYTKELSDITQTVYAIYGDRGVHDYPKRISDLNLPEEALMKLELKFVHDACHMMMIENPEELSTIIKEILKEEN